MDPGSRKRLIVISIIGCVLFGPLLALSSPVMGMIEEHAQKSEDKKWGASLQLKCAYIYGITLRTDEQINAYRKFYEVFKDDPHRGYAKFMVAFCMEKDLNFSRSGTVREYEDFIFEFQNDPAFQTLPDWRLYLEEADRAINRIKVN